MSTFIIEGGHELSGSIIPQGAKNEALQILSAILLTDEAVSVENVPEILDVKNLIDLLKCMGVSVTRHSKGEYTFIAKDIDRNYTSSALFCCINCSFIFG
jgi:UDP-N-acetylglucosamine 1-carboxyvinyltransferase